MMAQCEGWMILRMDPSWRYTGNSIRTSVFFLVNPVRASVALCNWPTKVTSLWAKKEYCFSELWILRMLSLSLLVTLKSHYMKTKLSLRLKQCIYELNTAGYHSLFKSLSVWWNTSTFICIQEVVTIWILVFFFFEQSSEFLLVNWHW